MEIKLNYERNFNRDYITIFVNDEKSDCFIYRERASWIDAPTRKYQFTVNDKNGNNISKPHKSIESALNDFKNYLEEA